MEVAHIAILVTAGLLGGFIAGLVGVGGGIIFAPVLFFYFQAIDIAPELVTPLTLGSSLFCTLIASFISGLSHHRNGVVLPRMAGVVGIFSALAVLLMTVFVTTKPWYDRTVFQLVFGAILLIAVGRMVMATFARGDAPAPPGSPRKGTPFLAGIGAGAGVVASAAGVGGGVVLVPAFNQLLRMPIKRAVGTSSATIVLISLAGVLTYMATGWGQPGTTFGYVDVGQAALLAVPAIVTARVGAVAAHRINKRYLVLAFATFAFIVAIRLIYGGLTEAI